MQEITSLPASLKTIANMIEDIKHTLKEIESRVNSQDAGLERLEAELDRQLHVQDRSSKEIHKLKDELEKVSWKSQNSIKNAEKAVPDILPLSVPQIPAGESTEPARHEPEMKMPVIQTNVPLMNGSGFSHITLDYLKSLSRK
jgi:uncharacterized coiled-coil protein SlyX